MTIDNELSFNNTDIIKLLQFHDHAWTEDKILQNRVLIFNLDIKSYTKRQFNFKISIQIETFGVFYENISKDNFPAVPYYH